MTSVDVGDIGSSGGTEPDPIVLEVLRGAFQSISNEMALTIEQSAYSLVITEGRDFSGALFTRDGYLVSQGQGDLPVHVGTAQPSLQSVIRLIGLERMRPGDIYVMNDPFLGSTHVNDVRLMMPIFCEGQVLAFVATSAHWTDMGGMVPGSFCPTARDCYQEGLRIPPATIVREGVLNQEILRIMLANVRIPLESEGDLHAQIAACRAGESRFQELTQKYGVETVRVGMTRLQDYAEKMFRAEIAELPDGEYRWEDCIDEDPYTGLSKAIRLKLTVHADSLTYDFSESDTPALCAINSHIDTTTAAALVTAKAVFPEIPMNAGLMRPVRVVTKPDTIVDVREPHGVGAGGATSWEKISNCCISVFSLIAPERTQAGSYNLLNLYFGGRLPDSGQSYICYVWSEGGQGATLERDGASATQSYWSASSMNIPVEVQERRGPILMEAYEMRPGTMGAGRHRGGAGTRRTIRVREGLDGARLSLFGDKGKNPGRGLLGGCDSGTQRVLLRQENGEERNLGMIATDVELAPGDRIVMETMGGAGFGDPFERDPESVLDDVRNELLSIDAALEEHRVVISEIDPLAASYELDLKATAAARERRSHNKPGDDSP